MANDIFRRRLDNHIDAECQRLHEIPGRPGIIDHADYVAADQRTGDRRHVLHIKC